MTLTGKIVNRAVALDVPDDWPDGTEVAVNRVEDEVTVGIREEDWPKTPEEIAEWLRWADTIQPLLFTPEEEAEIAADRRARRDYELATWDERHRKIESLFEWISTRHQRPRPFRQQSTWCLGPCPNRSRKRCPHRNRDSGLR